MPGAVAWAWLGPVLVAKAGLIGLGAAFWPPPGLRSRPVSGRRRAVRRGRRRIIAYGRGDGVRVAMLAGAGRGVADFNEFGAALVEAGFRTLAVEAPACGGTDALPGGASLYDLAADLHAALVDDQALHPCPATVALGHGFGQRVVRAAAERGPAPITACVLVSAGGPSSLTGSDGARFRRIFDPRVPASVRADNIAHLFFAPGSAVPAHWRRGWHWRVAGIQGAASAATADSDWRRAGSGPVLLLQGADDRIAPPDEVRAGVGRDVGRDRLRAALVEGAGHALLPEQSIRAARLVVDFLRRGAV